MISDDKVDLRHPISFEISGHEKAPDGLIGDALRVLETTSRTFFIPINRLPSQLLEAVGSGYLCMRAIDEIEDHPSMDSKMKVHLLSSISQTLQSAGSDLVNENFLAASSPFRELLPEVTVRIGDWARLAPRSIAGRIWDATATMAERMAVWVKSGWNIQTEGDLDRYTFGVAGAVGLMLSDIWAWYDGTSTDRFNAVGFGRGLQSVNILRNREADKQRGVDFFPVGWTAEEMQAYARRNLAHANEYMQGLPAGPVQDFCKLPLLLAYATVDAMQQGRDKLSRNEVNLLVQQVVNQ